MISLDDLSDRIVFLREAIERNVEPSAARAPKASKFWSDILSERTSYPDLNRLMTCRRAESERPNSDGNITGNIDRIDMERERAYVQRVHHLFRRMVSDDMLAALPPESSLGAPLAFEHDGLWRSANFWISAATTARIVEFVRRYGKQGPLRVLEIGSGWGTGVYQLHSLLDIESYTLIDLPENLYLSTLHLGTVLPERPVAIIDVSGDNLNKIPRHTIHAGLPGAIERIDAEYDLVINAFSFQEMDLASVRVYIDLIERVLSSDGIFVSLNSHGKTDVAKPSDYRYEKFQIHHWGVFRPYPSGFFNTIPYEIVAGRRRPGTPDYPVEIQDAIGRLMQSGIDGDLAAMCKSFGEGTLTRPGAALLSGYNSFLSASSDEERTRILASLREIDTTPVWSFVAALYALSRNDRGQATKLLDKAIEGGISGFARVRAEVFRAALSGRPLARLDDFDPSLAYPEIGGIVSTDDLDRAVVHIDRALGRSQ